MRRSTRSRSPPRRSRAGSCWPSPFCSSAGQWPRYGALIFLPGLALIATGLIGGPTALRELYLIVGTPTVGLCLVLLAVIAAKAVLQRQDVASLLLACAVTIVLTCWVHDMLSVLQLTPDRRIFFSRLSYSAMLVAIGAALTWRFARALNQVDSFAGRMVVLVREAEDKLKASFAREEERARAAALARERTRLMRDLHDGLGGQLVSIVAMSERDSAGAPIGDAARAALKDLRLVIDSMDDIGGDLMLALGSWRERAMAQLRPHDIALDWHAVPQGLPLHPELRPWHVVQIVRLLDEALTNAVKHAAARRIKVDIELLTDAAGYALRLHHRRRRRQGFFTRSRRDGGRPRHDRARPAQHAEPRRALRRRARAEVRSRRHAGAADIAAPLSRQRRGVGLNAFPDASSSGSASADAIDRATAVHRRSRTDTDTGRADADTRHGDAGRGDDHDRRDGPHHAALGHADRLAIDHRGLGGAAKCQRRQGQNRRRGNAGAQPFHSVQHHHLHRLLKSHAVRQWTDRPPRPMRDDNGMPPRAAVSHEDGAAWVAARGAVP